MSEAEPTFLGLNPGGWVALAMLFVFAILIWKKVPAAIGKALDGKIALIRDQLAEAENLRKEAEALKAEYEAKAASADSAEPCPVSKYITLSPNGPRPSDCAAARASARSARRTPKLSFAFCVPAIDWNTRSTGAPFSIASMVCVTCVSTHDCVGIAKRAMTSSASFNRSISTGRLSDTGLMPITASPAPSRRYASGER